MVDAGKQGRAPKVDTSKKIKVRYRSFELKKRFKDTANAEKLLLYSICMALPIRAPEISSASVTTPSVKL